MTRMMNFYDKFLFVLIQTGRLVSHTPKSETESHPKRVYSVDTPITYIIKILLKSNFFSHPFCEDSLQLPHESVDESPFSRANTFRLSPVFHFYLRNPRGHYFVHMIPRLSLSWGKFTQSTTFYPISLRSIFILSMLTSSVNVSPSEIRIDFSSYQYVPPAVPFPSSFIWSSE